MSGLAIRGFYYAVPEKERISFLLIAVSACVATVVVGYIASIIHRALDAYIVSVVKREFRLTRPGASKTPTAEPPDDAQGD